MSRHFPFDASPFNELNATDRALLHQLAHPVQFGAGDALLACGSVPVHLCIMRSGHVQLEEDGQVRVLRGGDAFHWRALLTGHNHATATALDEVQVWQLPKPALMTLLDQNVRFSAQVFSQLAGHLADNLDTSHHRELMSLLLMRVKDVALQAPFYLDGQSDLVSACRVLSAQHSTGALVRDVQDGIERIGLFSTADLRDALLGPTPPNALAVRDVARFDLQALPPDAELSDALLLMQRQRVQQVLVREGDAVLGLLSQLDLMGLMSSHSHLIARQIEQAETVADLRTTALLVNASIKLLERGGMRIDIICKLVSRLNGQIFTRLWSLLAPPELVQNSCLLVMGSEGRSEQVLKTDQDNALLLRDGYHCPALAQVTQQFSAALLTFGYPPCPGDIMVTNPLWCQSLSAFQTSIDHWLFRVAPEGRMNLAIFLDARAVAGDARLLDDARAHALKRVGDPIFLMRMASAIEQFGEPASGWWSRLKQLQVRRPKIFDLKKIGTFPIVHGTRVLALEYRLEALGTVDRLQALASQSRLAPQMAHDLIDALNMLMALKLRNNLRQMSLEQPISNLLELGSLGTLEHDMLKDALAIVRQFKQHLRHRYHIGA